MSEEYEYLVARGAGEPGTVLARTRLAHRQAELLAALVAGGPLPDGFDAAQVRVQAAGLAAKRRDTVAKVAPELPVLLGGGFAPAFRRYAEGSALSGGYRADALAFARWALDHADGMTKRQRRALERWYADRAGPAPRRTVRALLGSLPGSLAGPSPRPGGRPAGRGAAGRGAAGRGPTGRRGGGR
ncbi:hypothetical protein LO771_11870 [Streptacidiphilus sp. ASG 303]|nr:hypothetical protein [Streptacidiphilus sp. ASG 303]MCD0483081.1 hypothetical protein [Streptacidiphilus sp. ASG 303]